ncbi:hypothetical protein [uncultured Fibrella sp.]|uniref:hypothetical protein n=1 Tax=uncultured Fibrella sp. TaxID=1284596 RepID=UPI0035CB9E51
MNKHRSITPFVWLLAIQFMLAITPLQAQDQALTQRDKDEIKRQAEKIIKLDLPARINNLVVEDLNETDRVEIMHNCYLPNTQQIFVDDAVLIEDDVDPAQTGEGLKKDKPVRQYLSDLLSYYAKNPDPEIPSFVISKVVRGDVFAESATSATINIFYSSQFKGSHKSGRTYQTVNRSALFQATRLGKKWVVLIRQIIFYRPGAGQTQTAGTVTAPVTATVAVVAPPPPPQIDIREPMVVYNQEDYDFTITIRANKKALDVVKSDSPRVPLGQYRNNGDGNYELAGNSIRFDETDKNRFIYKNRDRDIMGFVRLKPAAPKPDTTRAVAAKPLPDVVTPGYLPLNPDQRKRKVEPPVSTSVAESVAVVEPKPTAPTAANQSAEPVKQPPKPQAEPPKPAATPPVAEQKQPVIEPVAEPPKVVATTVKPVPELPKPPAEKPTEQKAPDMPIVTQPASKLSLPAPVLADVPRAVEKEKLPKPIIQKPAAMSVSPTLKKSLTSEQQRIVSGMRLRGWMQVVGGLAALGGSYVAYSGIRKDYDAYSQKVNALNADYNLYRDLSRRAVLPPPNVLSMTEYGSPTIYGVYGGGVIGLGLTVNGIRTLLRAGKMSKKK